MKIVLAVIAALLALLVLAGATSSVTPIDLLAAAVIFAAIAVVSP